MPEGEPMPDNLYRVGTVWYARVQVGGRRYKKSLRTDLLAEAKIRRDHWIRELNRQAFYGEASSISAVEKIRPERRAKTVRDILEWRIKHLDETIMALASAATHFAAEVPREDKLHAARLRQRRQEVLGCIRAARELMPDWPITDQDIAKWVEQQKWLKLLE
jgi:hypothetical protein